MVTWPDALIRELADRRTLIFVGAGLSKSAYPAMPTWPDLLLNLSTELPKKVDKTLVRKLVNQHRLLDAAQIITDGIERPDLNASLQAVFRRRPTPHNDIYKDLLQLDQKIVVTTNYDEFLERNFDHYSGGNAAYVVQKHTSGDLLSMVRSPQSLIVKMHGCISEPNDLVLDRMSFFRAKQRYHGFFGVMAALLTTHTVLFLGYSLGDPDLQIILENIHSASESTHGHYALLPRIEHRSVVRAIKQSYNISCIEYPSANHSVVPACLQNLQQAVAASRAARGVG